jgi:hypothetical protein
MFNICPLVVGTFLKSFKVLPSPVHLPPPPWSFCFHLLPDSPGLALSCPTSCHWFVYSVAISLCLVPTLSGARWVFWIHCCSNAFCLFIYFFGTGDWTQHLSQARQGLYHLSHTPSSSSWKIKTAGFRGLWFLVRKVRTLTCLCFPVQRHLPGVTNCHRTHGGREHGLGWDHTKFKFWLCCLLCSLETSQPNLCFLVYKMGISSHVAAGLLASEPASITLFSAELCHI